MNRVLALLLCIIMLSTSLSGCFGNSDGDDDENSDVNEEKPSEDESDTDINQENQSDSGNISDNNSNPDSDQLICPDGAYGSLNWGEITCFAPEVYKTSDVSNETVNLTLKWYNIAVAEWGNFGPVEIYIVGSDMDAAEQLEDEYCQRHKDLDSKWKEEWDCANANYQIFTNYVNEGGAAISTLKKTHLDYDFFMMIMSAKYPGPEEESYKPVTLHEYFHIYQHSHISDKCSSDTRDTCERDAKMGGKGNPWWAEGGAEYMAQTLYSKQEGVRDNYLQEVMKWKLELSRDGYNNQNTSLDNLTRDSQINVYDVGSWFVAYLIHHEGEDAFVNGFYGDVDKLGFDVAFENNFNKTKREYVADFDVFFEQPVEDIMAIIPDSQPAQLPEKVWMATVSGSQEESHGHFILACDDGGFLQIGETGFIPNSAKLMVAKVDQNGQQVWKKEFGTIGHNLGNSAIEVSDGYVIVGAINQDSTVMKLDKQSGSTIFIETEDNGGSDALESIVKISNGYVAVGYIMAQDSGNTFFTEGTGHMVFLDDGGKELSEQSLNSHMAHAYRIGSYNDELFVSGLTEETLDYALLKMDQSGSIIWSKTFGGNSYDHNFAFDIGSDGSIFLSGHTLSGTDNWDAYTMKISNNGDLIWEDKRGNPRGFNPLYIHDEVWGAKATTDGGVIIVAGTGDEYESYSECNVEDCSDSWRVYLIKYNSAGGVEWEVTYASDENGDWAGEDICLTSDGGAVVAVDNGQFGFLKISPI
jgi:hypothetical protein